MGDVERTNELILLKSQLKALHAELAQERELSKGALAKLKSAEAGERSERAKLLRQLQEVSSRSQALRDQLDIAQKQKAFAEFRTENTRNSISFRLGKALIETTKSWRGLVALPGKLSAIGKDAMRPRALKSGVGALVPPGKLMSAPPPAPIAPAASAPATARATGPGVKSRPVKRARDFKVAFIADEFTFNSFKDEFQAVPLEPADWREKFEAHKPDIFFCESAWSGPASKRRPWKGQVYASVNFPKENRTTLLDILAHCRKEGIPSVFWNKEDPTHYSDRVHDFAKTAKEFDFVFTSAAECMDGYRREHGVANVFVLPFATNPRLFNPLETGERSSNIVFAGSWYANHKERSAAMERMLDQFREQGFGLEICDRYHGDSDPLHKWPEKYLPFVKPGMPHDHMPKVYKSSRFGLNFNTVTGSPTMFARRVFELMSSNTLVISNHSRGVEDMFGELVVFPDRDPGQLGALSDTAIDDLRERALDLVLREHTYAKRWLQILSAIGVPHLPDEESMTVASMIRAREDALAAVGWFQLNSQMLPGARLLLVISADVADLEAARLYQEFNRFGVGVTSVSHAAKYALEGFYRPIETSHFALIDPRDPPPLDWLKRAALHLQYMDEYAIAPAATPSQRYRIAAAKPAQPLVGTASLFAQFLRPGATPADVYYV